MIAVYKYHGLNQFSMNREVVIDDEIALWLARMAVGEGGPDCEPDKTSAMVWAMLNRFFLHKARKKWKTFLYMLTRFSQPINTRWAEGGDLAIKYAGTKYTTPYKMKRRKRIQSLKWEDIEPAITNVICDFQVGIMRPPQAVRELERPRITNWASHENLPIKRPWGIALDDSDPPDWFFEDRKIIPGTVVVDHWG